MFHRCNTIFVYCSPARPWPKHKALSLWSRWWVIPLIYMLFLLFQFYFLNNLNDFMPQRLFHNQWCHYSYWTYICPLIISADLLMLGKMGFFFICFFCLITIHMQIHVIDWCSKKVFKFKRILRIYNVQFINIPQCLYL